MRFVSKPYEVKIIDEGREYSLPVHNANGIFKSIELEKKRKATEDLNQEFIKFQAKLERLSELEKRERNADEEKEYSSETSKSLELQADEFLRKLRIATADFIREAVKDLENHIGIIDEIKQDEQPQFISCIQRAGFGYDDEAVKKNTTQNSTSKESEGGDIPEKKLKRGRHTKRTTYKKSMKHSTLKTG